MCPLMQKLEHKCQNFGIDIWLPWRRAKRFWPFWCLLAMKMYEKCSKFARGKLFLCAVMRQSYIIYLKLQICLLCCHNQFYCDQLIFFIFTSWILRTFVNMKKNIKIKNIRQLKSQISQKAPILFLMIFYKSIYSLWCVHSYKIGVSGLFYK